TLRQGSPRKVREARELRGPGCCDRPLATARFCAPTDTIAHRDMARDESLGCAMSAVRKPSTLQTCGDAPHDWVDQGNQGTRREDGWRRNGGEDDAAELFLHRVN